MTEYKREIIRDYSPPSDDEISKHMDFSGIEKGIAQSPAATLTGSATLITKGIIALSFAGIALIFLINYSFKDDSKITEDHVDLSKAGIYLSRVGNISGEIQHPDELTYIEFPSPKESITEVTKSIPAQTKAQSQKPKSPNSEVIVTNRFTDAKPVVGFDSLYSYLRNSLIYPLKPPADTVDGVVEISFVVGKSGDIRKPTIVTSMGELFDEEAIRVIKSMPKWEPAKVNETPLSTKKQIAIQFKRQN